MQLFTDLGIELVQKNMTSDGFCGSCQTKVDPAQSTARFLNLFCSLSCEQRFINQALRFLTLADCIRIQQRLDALLASTQDK
jgi:hypothetical protein